MPLEHELELVFPTDKVPQPIICEMARAVDVVFSIQRASISHQQGRMLVRLTGEPDAVREAEALLTDRGVELTVATERTVDGPLPDVPRAEFAPGGGPVIERKCWLTFDVAVIEQPVLWEMSRRFNVIFDVRQSSIGRDVGIVGLLLRGPRDQLDAACAFLTDLGVEVEPIEKSVVEL